MNKIILHDADVNFILRWRDEHKELVREGLSPLSEVKLIFQDVSITVTAIRRDAALTFSVTKNGKSQGKLLWMVLSSGNYMLVENKSKLSEENIQSVLTIYASTMALLVYGKSTVEQETRELVGVAKETPSVSRRAARHKAKMSDNIVYILSSPNAQGGKGGHHKSPEGVFSVRGHYRHYKSGKVVWIAEYSKGKGMAKDKTYKLSC